jgi:hypothetical protein
MQVYCETCEGERSHQEVAQPYELNSGIDAEIRWFEKYYIAKCRGCETITFVKKHGNEEMWELDAFGEQEYTFTFTVYHEALVNRQRRRKRKDFKHVPDFIKYLYTEVIDAYNRNLLILCPVGQRMIIEAICQEKGIEIELLSGKDGTPKLDDEGQQKYRNLTLSEKIDILQSSGYITPIQAAVLHQIKGMGNDAAHKITKHDDEIIGAALEVLESMLYSIYELAGMHLYKK